MTTIRLEAHAQKHCEFRLRKGADLYVFRYDAETRLDLLDRLEVYASDKRLSFDWDDFYLLRGVLMGVPR